MNICRSGLFKCISGFLKYIFYKIRLRDVHFQKYFQAVRENR
jgi:hypothetical protein